MKSITLLISIFFIVACQAQKIPQIPKVKPVSDIKYRLACGSEIKIKKIDNWYNEKYVDNKVAYYDFKKSKNLKRVKEQYSIKKDILFYNGKKVDSLLIFYRQSENVNYSVYIINGRPTGYTIDVNNNPNPSMYSVTYDKDGNLNYNFIEQHIYLHKGNGIIKNYYYGEWNGKNQSFSKEVLKEEGEVENNFKVGEWKYYNKEGRIDSIKTYTLKDAVDIRFPYCIFNKNEPCY
ncbi:hypothetical protein ACFONJ_22870 [Chryseobacterium tructae]|uniref:MORN repeat variant n=2 Tax=Chryseobacterium tructae TaxID=1037380 RepID=A0ABV7Y0N6_9FLAO